jgi:uncharacterized phiE125 gp8 family phage protein
MRNTTQFTPGEWSPEHPVTVDEVVTRLRLDDADESDELAMLIAAASDFCAGVLRRSVSTTAWRLRSDEGFPRGNIPIRLIWPQVNSIISVSYITALSSVPVVLDAADYRLAVDELLYPSDALATWPTDATEITVEYLAGWGTITPESVKLWILLQIGHWYRNREAATDRQMMKVPFADRLLDRYRIVEV